MGKSQRAGVGAESRRRHLCPGSGLLDVPTRGGFCAEVALGNPGSPEVVEDGNWGLTDLDCARGLGTLPLLL